MAKMFDKVELIEEIKTDTGRPIQKGSRGTVMEVNSDNFYTVEIKIHNAMMLRSYEFKTITVSGDKFRVVEPKAGNSLMSASKGTLNLY